MKTMNEYLKQEGSLALNLAFYKKFSNIGDNVYTDICGGFIEGVYQWSTHNIYNVTESNNKKYTGFTLEFSNGYTARCYIENWVMNIKPKNWKHGKNLFNKYLKVCPQK